jgi:hypothetical protein
MPAKERPPDGNLSKPLVFRWHLCNRIRCAWGSHLSHGDEGEAPVLHGAACGGGVCLNLFAGGVAGEQDEEDGRGRAGFCHDCCQIKSILDPTTPLPK